MSPELSPFDTRMENNEFLHSNFIKERKRERKPTLLTQLCMRNLFLRTEHIYACGHQLCISLALRTVIFYHNDHRCGADLSG